MNFPLFRDAADLLCVRHVLQKHPNGCVIACLAMITGKTYDEVSESFIGDRATEGISDGRYDPWLAYQGFSLQRIYKHYSPQQADRKVWPPEPFADVHLVSTPSPIGHHATIWLRDGTILDPLCEAPRRITDYDEPNAVAGVYRVGLPIDPGPLRYLHWSFGSAENKCRWCGTPNDQYQYRDPCPARNKVV